MKSAINSSYGLPFPITERDRREQVYMLVGFWVEAFIYGIYFVLFFAAVHLLLKGRRKDHRGPKILFATVAVVMFVLTSIYTGVNIFRFIEAYALGLGPKGVPIWYFRDFGVWENYIYVLCSSLLFWTADILVIYRCYIIWGRNYRVITIPSILLLASISTNAVNIYWFKHPLTIPFHPLIKLFLDFVYPGHLAQNILTTGLIAYKICKQHFASQASGIHSSSNITLLSVARLIVESAMVYTLQLTCLVALYFLNHPAMVILQAAIVPSVGIVFVLLSIRVHMAMLENERLPHPSSIVLPSWVHGTDSPESSGRTSFALLSMLREDMESPDTMKKAEEV